MFKAKICHKRKDGNKWVRENQSQCALLMDVKQKLWRCKRCSFAAKRFLEARHHKGRLNFTDVGLFAEKCVELQTQANFLTC
jgi:hypothetical protein